MSRTPIRVHRPTGRTRRPCGLRHHQPGHKVKWQSWDTERGCFVWHRGTVVAHVNRTLRIEGVDGITEMSCGPVLAVGR